MTYYRTKDFVTKLEPYMKLKDGFLYIGGARNAILNTSEDPIELFDYVIFKRKCDKLPIVDTIEELNEYSTDKGALEYLKFVSEEYKGCSNEMEFVKFGILAYNKIRFVAELKNNEIKMIEW